MRLALFAAVSMLSLGFVDVAQAQAQSSSNVVLMRRSLDPKTRTFAWVPGEWSQCSNSCGAGQQTRTVQCMLNGKHGTPEVNCTADRLADAQACYDIQGCSYTWKPTEWTDVAGCGQVVETRDLTCMRGDGQTVSNDQCPAPAPETSREVRDLRTCSYDWKTDQWSAFSGECQTAATSTRNVWCERSNGEKVTDAECSASGAKPDATRTEDRYGQCGYAWKPGAWSAWSSTCETGAVRSRDVVCQRSNGDVVPDAMCSSDGPRPETRETSDQYGSCSYSWKPGAYGAPVSACGATVQVRPVTCVRSNGDTVADAQCDPAKKPTTEQPATDYSTCTYGWQAAEWGAWSSACGQATQTRAVTCVSSDGRTVSDSFCSGARPSTSQSAYQTSGCGYSWNAGTFGAPAAACGATTQTRSVTCLRSDGETVADGFCAAGSRPSPTQAATDYSACSYGWNGSGWEAWSTSCGQATQSRSVWCQRSDGATVGDASCAGTKPAASQAAYQTSGCGYTWQAGGWGSPTAACGASTQSRSVWCQRSDGTTVDGSLCGAGKPASSQGTTDYSACSYGWAYGGWNTTSQTCGSVSQSRSVWCQRSDGTSVADGFCGGGKPAASQSFTDYSACSYRWVAYGYPSQQAICGTASHSRDVACIRGDGTRVSDAYCSAGTKPATSESYTNYLSCSYSVTGWSSWSYASSCSANTTATQTATGCRRSDGTAVALSECSSRGVATTQTTQMSNLSNCSYSWQTGGWSAQTGQCGTGYQTRDVWCQRADGARIDESLCTGTRPSASLAYANYDSCSYRWSPGAWSGWSASCGDATRNRAVHCDRSDGTRIYPNSPNNEWGKCYVNPYPANSESTYLNCSYRWTTGAWSPWSTTCGNATRNRAVDCDRSDGVRIYPDSPNNEWGKCYVNPYPANSESAYISSGCSLGYSGEGRCSGGSQLGSMIYRFDNALGSSYSKSGYTGSGYNLSSFQNWCTSQGGNCVDENSYGYREYNGTRNTSGNTARCYANASGVNRGVSYDNPNAEDGAVHDYNNWYVNKR